MFLPQDAEMQLEKFYIHTPKDHMIFRKLSESDKVELTKELIEAIYDNSVKKSLSLDYSELEKSKGDITKIPNYEVLKGSIDLLTGIQMKMKEKILGLDAVLEAHKQLIENKSNFEMAYRLNNQHVILLYNNITVALVCSVSFLIVATIDYIKDPTGKYEIHYKNTSTVYKQFPTIFLSSLERFNKLCKDGSLTHFFKLLYSKKNLVESWLGSLLIGIPSAIAIFIVLIPFIRELIYQYYYMRIQISDYLRLQANFIELNKTDLARNSSSYNQTVIRKQEQVVDLFIKLADKIDVDQKISTQQANSDINSENKEIKLQNTNYTSALL